LPKSLVRKAEEAAQQAKPCHVQNAISVALSILVAYLSIAPVLNLVSNRQVMNSSFDPLDLVNTYGAFGSVGKERYEIIFEGTDDAVISGDTKWKEYEFKAKPGDPNRRPPFVAPYQPRIDWQIWFAAMASPAEYPWTLHFVWKLLHNDRGTPLAPGQQSLSRRAASLHSRAAVSLSFRADWRSGMVETGTSWRMAAGALD
jgi:hypothetical protein